MSTTGGRIDSSTGRWLSAAEAAALDAERARAQDTMIADSRALGGYDADWDDNFVVAVPGDDITTERNATAWAAYDPDARFARAPYCHCCGCSLAGPVCESVHCA